MPDLAVVAEGDLPSGEHWMLRAGGTAENYYTFLKTVHRDGHSDEGGMGGPLLYPGSCVNSYTGGSDQGLQRVVARTHSGVRRLRLELDTGERRELLPVASDPDLDATFFAALLPWALGLVSLQALDADGQVLEPSSILRHPPR